MQEKILSEKDIPDLNIFMMCEKLNNNALSELPEGFHIRTCKPEELKYGKNFPLIMKKKKKNITNI